MPAPPLCDEARQLERSPYSGYKTFWHRLEYQPQVVPEMDAEQWLATVMTAIIFTVQDVCLSTIITSEQTQTPQPFFTSQSQG